MTATISIICPVKDGERYLDELIASILHQTFREWELIFINDHSTDHSSEMVQAFAQGDQRIQLFNNNGNGIINALITGLKKCQGEYLTRIDSDDLMPPDRIQTMKRALDICPQKSIMTGQVKYFSDHEISEGYQKYEHWLNQVNTDGHQWANIYRECVIASPNWMIRTNELKEMGGFEGLSYPEDYDLVFRWYQHGFKVETLDKVTLHWREHPQRTSRNSTHYDQQHFFDLKLQRFLELDWNQQPILIWGNNPKTVLCSEFFSTHQIPFELLQLKDYQKTTDFDQSQLLVGVYPEQSERVLLEQYLVEIGRIQGKNWWYI